MRRTTTAWIAGTLGAGLTASIVLAQQLPSSSSSRAGTSAAGSSTPSTTPSLYGAAGAHGARYLMRNGLDYLNYQQYERALKFLREAEANQKELTAPEIVALKQGIERARNGLRAAADQGPAYALSEQPQRRNGFTAARPETAVAQQSDRVAPSARTPARSGRALFPGADEGPGDPIRLTSTEAPVGGLLARPSGSTPAKGTPTALNPQTASAEIPTLTAPEIPTLTAVPSSSDPSSSGSVANPTPSQGLATAAPQPAPRDLVINAAAPAPEAMAPTARDPEPSPVAVSPTGPATPSTDAGPGPQPTAGPAPASPATGSPSLSPVETAPSPVVETPQPAIRNPQSATETAPSPVQAPAPILLETLEPAAIGPAPTAGRTPPTGPAPSTGGLIPTAMQDTASPASVTAAGGVPPAAGGTTSPGTVETDAIPLPPLSASPPVADSPAAPTHRESEEPAAMAPAASTTSPSGMAPAAALDAEPIAPRTDELPPLPGDLARDEAVTNPTGGVTQAGAATATPASSEPLATSAAGGSVAPHAEDETLPPLPVGIDAPAPIDSATAPAPIATTTTATGPATATAIEENTRNPVDPGSATQPPAAAEPSPTIAPAADPQGAAAPGSISAPTGGAYPLVGTEPGTGTSPGSASDTAAAKPDPNASAGSSPGAGASPRSADFHFTIPERPNPTSTLNAELRRKVEEVARIQNREEEMRLHTQLNRPQPDNPPRDNSSSTLQIQTQLDIIHAPSPAEARPIKAIPVPEDWVPLAARNWSPQRKYWAAAATCHLPLYFQDPVLERYGHSVEQFLGPNGRFLTYPVDDPKQSTQRNQIVQPFFSWGLFAFQIAAWPYNAIMDSPWEAQYDLGYYRPGDVIPVDTYWLPLHGYGPPLRGNRY